MSQGEQLEALCALLGEETRVCGALSGVLRDEQAAAIGLDPDGIIGCLAERRLLHEQLAQLAAARGELLPLLAPKAGERVRDGLRTLRRALLEARGLGRQNALFAAASLDGVGELLRALGGLMPGARYGADARVAARGGPTNRIDRRV
ncbi:MAG: flagellar protein FlgN [Deltaproteobacteria bacterium]|nr:MAG: flagellar protein FlgN [Deltaproteobacteria bacterium]